MKLQNYQQAASPGAGALSVSLKEKEVKAAKPAKNPKQEEEDLWQEISDDLARGSSPLWRMWR